VSSLFSETRTEFWYHLSTVIETTEGKSMDQERVDEFGHGSGGLSGVPAKLRELMARQGISQRELARRAGLSLTIVNVIATGKYPGGTTIGSFEKIANALGTSIGELFGGAQPVADPAEELALLRQLHSGEAPGLHRIAARLDELQARAAELEAANDAQRPRLEVLGGAQDTLLVPLYGHAAAGLGAYNEPVSAWTDVEKIPVPRSLRPSDGQLLALQVRGESMEPELSEGDVVVVHYPERQPALKLLSNGQLVVVTTEDGADWNDYLKRVSLDPATGLETLVSSNSAYAPITVRQRDIRFVGSVKMIVRK
jgi:phage repressor protein C with HTH and peptisase S24 domain/DNA-binding Xre family transcriptional regulator